MPASFQRSFFLLLQFLVPLLFTAQVTVNLNDNAEIIPLGKSVAIYEDKTASLDIHQIRSAQYDTAFRQSHEDIPNFNVSKSAFWCKIFLHNTSGNTLWHLEQAVGSMLSAECFVLRNDSVTNYYRKGFFDAFGERNPSSVYPTFALNIPKDSSITVYIRLMDSSPFNANLNIAQPYYLIKRNHVLDIINGFYYGMMFILMLYNLFIYFSVRERTYIYYMFYILCASLFISILTGYLGYFPPRITKIFGYYPSITGCLFGIFALCFTASFLDIRRNAPKWARTFNVLVGLMVLDALVGLLGFRHESIMFIQLLGFVLSFFSIAIGIVVLKKGYKPAKFYLTAWGVYMLGLVIYILTDLSVLPFNMFTHNSLQLGSVFEAVFLSVALADKVSAFKQDKEIAQEKALQIAHENEKLIREQNIVLEQKVKERTSEIEQQKKIIEERQKEILDSIHYAKRIQKSLLPSEKYIERKLKK